MEAGQTVIVTTDRAKRLRKVEVERVLPTGKVVVNGRHYDLSTRKKCGRSADEVLRFDKDAWDRFGRIHVMLRAVDRWPLNFPLGAREQLERIWDATVRELRADPKENEDGRT